MIKQRGEKKKTSWSRDSHHRVHKKTKKHLTYWWRPVSCRLFHIAHSLACCYGTVMKCEGRFSPWMLKTARVLYHSGADGLHTSQFEPTYSGVAPYERLTGAQTGCGYWLSRAHGASPAPDEGWGKTAGAVRRQQIYLVRWVCDPGLNYILKQPLPYTNLED